MNNPILSIVILSFNTKEVLAQCLDSLKKLIQELSFEVIVIDNASSDGSLEMLASKYTWVRSYQNEINLGFAAGNNIARKYVKGEYILFLNSDTVIYSGALSKTFDFISARDDVGAVTCKLLLSSGKPDLDARRSFPTPWVALTHFSYLDRLFPTSRLFSRYWYGYLPSNKTHEVDSLEGAYCLARKKVLDEVGWFDETYFLDGEDIDLCWKIKNAGYKIYYYPDVWITHFKGISKGKTLTSVKKSNRLKFVTKGVDSMEIFYRKHIASNYPIMLNF